MKRDEWENLIGLARAGYSACEQAEALGAQGALGEFPSMAKQARRRERDTLNELGRTVNGLRSALLKDLPAAGAEAARETARRLEEADPMSEEGCKED